MFDRGLLVAVALLALFLLACGPTPAQVNNSGHEPYRNSDFAAALDTYRGAQARSPESGEPYYNAGNVLYRMEEYQGSLQEYDESLRYAESELRSRGFFNRGNAEFRVQQYAQAIEAYKEVLRMNPDDIDAKHNLELALLQIPPGSRPGAGRPTATRPRARRPTATRPRAGRPTATRPRAGRPAATRPRAGRAGNREAGPADTRIGGRRRTDSAGAPAAGLGLSQPSE